MNKALRNRFLYSGSGNNRKSKIQNLKCGVLVLVVAAALITRALGGQISIRG